MEIESKEASLIWTSSLENILKEWAELSRVHSFLHSQAHLSYKKRSNYFAIPVIVLSTLSGFVSMSLPQFNFSEFDKNVAAVSIGLVNIGCGVLQTLSQILKINELSHQHLTASADYEALALDIEVELRLERGFRKEPTNFLKTCRSTFERLEKGSPIVPSKISEKFKARAKISHRHIPDSISLEFEELDVNRKNFSGTPLDFRLQSPKAGGAMEFLRLDKAVGPELESHTPSPSR